jgi:M-phase inducer tyrosine phosphatase
VIDCRFPFEFEGGHIDGAVNFWTAERAIHALFVEPCLKLGNNGRTIVIFHCEFSSHRAPTMLKNIRTLDKAISAGTRGLLLPELYILEDGYSKYIEAYPEDCSPQG